MPGELEIIARIRERASRTAGAVAIGDDAAVFSHPSDTDLLACCDLMVEGVHFRSEWIDARTLGRKALAITLSDIAAMGGKALHALVSIALPPSTSSEFVNLLISGLFDYADECGVQIIGGDTSRSSGLLFIDTMAIGECARGKAIRRSGARGGDLIFVTGDLGASALGLKLLEEGLRLDTISGESEPIEGALEAIRKHLLPKPRLAFGQALGETGLATSMIDISDGLSTDLCHLLEESHCGALIRGDSIPVANGVSERMSDREALSFALSSGEEYELLFTAPIEGADRVLGLGQAMGVPLAVIGEIQDEPGARLQHDGEMSELPPTGYEHRI